MVRSGAIALLLALCGIQSARFKQSSPFDTTIAGVTVYGFDPKNVDWVMFFKPNASDSTIGKRCKGMCKFMGHPSQRGVGFASFRGAGDALREILSNQFDIAFVEPVARVSLVPEITSNADEESATWGLRAIGASSRLTTGKGVHIYVQDTGIRTSHTEFGGRASSAFDATTGLACNGDASCAADAQGHGSHCAGTAAGAQWGVAPDAKVYAVKTLSDEGSGSSDWQFAGIDYVASQGKRPAVLSMSLGGPRLGPGTAYDLAFQAAMDSGVVTVVAAGNSNTFACLFSPAFSSKVITVGATDSNSNRASYSNYGSCVDIMAPGSAVMSVSHKDDESGVAYSGTSMACPHVSGAAALLLQNFPKLKTRGILQKMKENALKGTVGNQKWRDPEFFLFVGTNRPKETAKV